MSVFSGKNGKVTIGGSALGDVLQWDFNKRTAVHKRNTSSSAGSVVTVAGRFEGDGTIRALVNTTSPYTAKLDDGQLVALKLYVDATRFYAGNARIENVQVGTNIDEAGFVEVSFTFHTDGAWSNPTW